ncbi:hypothetical protein NA57DRAFT_70234 [Rhizodiscina lignyota]|uniref:Uncharacterized protein n=1 Tax=Rhizodiscina lignyota TaxID=1504668 RepID=A0A9P4MB64_9PEZI|nr:hypothetical protein NA57DRAFT_70234 [Rhizodiscina lignyota]
MASTQRATRRRTAYHAFDDENEAPHTTSKKVKVDGVEHAHGKVNGERSKKARPSYDENDDGFQFSRSRAKKTQTKTTAPHPEPEPAPVEARVTTPKRRRKKYSFSESAKKDNDASKRVRRSARLSGEKEPVRSPLPEPEPEPKSVNQVTAPEVSVPAPKAQEEIVPQVNSEVEVAKGRTPKKIALPFADTPVIRRNKEMRKKNSDEGHRRSSTGMRGRRASSLIESGTSHDAATDRAVKSSPAPMPIPFRSVISEELEANSVIFVVTAVPHADVEPRDFYKHIEQSIPEPRRMKQLLTWCAKRALPEKQSGDGTDGGAALAARHIEEEILKDIANRPEMSDWFTREELEPAVLVKRPNPRNAQMASKLQELEEDIRRLQEERDSWEALLESSSASSLPAPSATTPHSSQTVALDGERRPKLRPHPLETETSQGIDVALLDPSQASIFASLTQPTTLSKPSTHPTAASESSSTAQSLSNHLSSLTAKIEPAVDLFADGVHKISQYRVAAERVADRILASSAQSLERRSRETQAQAAAERGIEGEGVRDMKGVLGALASVLNGQ